MNKTDPDPVLLRLTAQIVAAHAAHNQITSESLCGLIRTGYGALAESWQVGVTDALKLAATEEAKPWHAPVVPVAGSVFPDHIVCLEDGKKLRTLKRHLMAVYRMTPDQYRREWGLPANYPMIAPAYTALRSALAKQHGLGRNPVSFSGHRGRQARSSATN